MTLHPLRLSPGADLRRSLEQLCVDSGIGAFVVSGLGSLGDARIRLAAAPEESVIPGPLELLTISGSISPDGAHLHVCVADAQGRVTGGHLGYGNEVRTTAELLLAWLPAWQLSREVDDATGYKELTLRPRPEA